MSEVKQFRAAERAFVPYGGPPGDAKIARVIGPETSATMGAGVAVFEGISVPWTVRYDEVIIVLEGDFRLRAGEAVYDCGPGDMLWIPENTALAYEADGRATVFYALYPVDWKERAPA